MLMDVLYVVHHALPLGLHDLWVAIRSGGCSPVEVVYNRRHPQLQILTVLFLGRRIQSLAETLLTTNVKYYIDGNVISRITLKLPTSGYIPFPTCQTSKKCLVPSVHISSRTHLATLKVIHKLLGSLQYLAISASA